MDDINIRFQRPEGTHAVNGQHTVGRTGEGEAYAAEAVYADCIGYGQGDTPTVARAAAAASLRTKLADPHYLPLR